MTRMNHLGILFGLATAMLIALAPDAFAADANMQVPRREGFVGSALPIRIIVTDAVNDVAPDMPPVQGLSIERMASPMVSTSFQSSNGRTSQRRETTWTFLVTATKSGNYTIPPFDVEVDGKLFRTSALDLVFVQSEANDLLRVDVEGNPGMIFLGESTSLTLKIWIKPYRDTQYGTELSALDMWNLVSQGSQWGPFSSAIETMQAQRQAPRGRLVTVPGNEEDEPGLAYLYEIHVDDWPDRIGTIDAGAVRIDVQYPLSLTRTRGFFNSGLSIEETRPISASPRQVDVSVKPLPTEGQPEWFSGAVGRFVFDITASPTDVAVGDPITLRMVVRDQGRRPANMELLQSPKLARMPELEDSFRVPREQLGGTVEGRTKVFTQTIRAEHDGLQEIPALPFSFFDPVSRSYETSWSRPIPLTVSSAASVTTRDVVGNSGLAQATPDELRNVAGGILANYTGPGLLEDRSVDFSWWILLLLVLPPLAVLGTAGLRKRLDHLQGDSARTRERAARRNALSSLEEGVDVATVLTTYVADRLNLAAAGLTRIEAIDQLLASGLKPEQADLLDHVLGECEQRQYTGGGSSHDDELVQSARECIDAIEGVRFQ